MNGKLYIEKLKEAYEKRGLGEQWNHLIDIAEGISQEERELLLKEYPEFPQSLMEIIFCKRHYGK